MMGALLMCAAWILRRYLRFCVRLPSQRSSGGTAEQHAGEQAFQVQMGQRYSPRPLALEDARQVLGTAEGTVDDGMGDGATVWAIMLNGLVPKTQYVLRVRVCVDGVVGSYSAKSKPWKTEP